MKKKSETIAKKLKPLIAILGPTASGKSELAIKLARKFNGEIISCDSRQFYKKMDIGTNKIKNPKSKIQNYKLKLKNKEIKKYFYDVIKNVPHYMIDIIEPDQSYSVAEYKKATIKIINNILSRGKIPFLVGGTGLYAQAIIDNLEIPQVPPNLKLRQLENKLKIYLERNQKTATKNSKLIKKERIKFLKPYYDKLIKLDPDAKKIIQKDNARRIIRALEVCLATGKKFSTLRKKGKPLFNVLQIGINLPRKKLYKQIDLRTDKMIKSGLILETKKLLKKYSPNLPSMSGIGYKEISDFLAKKQGINETIQKIKYRNHDYARRQLIWFRKNKKINWVKNEKMARKLIKNFLNKSR